MSFVSAAAGALGQQGGGAAYDVLTAVSWTSAYWTEDPNWTPPADEAEITSIPDAITGTGNNLTAVGTGPTYDANGLGGQPSMRRDSAVINNHYLAGSAWSSALSQPFTIVGIVLAGSTGDDWSDTGGSPRTLLDVSSGNLRLYASGSYATSLSISTVNPSIIIAEFNGASSTAWVNGTNSGTGNAGTNGLNAPNLFLTAAAASPTGGHIAFYGFYDDQLTSDERTGLQNWANSHYGITIS